MSPREYPIKASLLSLKANYAVLGPEELDWLLWVSSEPMNDSAHLEQEWIALDCLRGADD